MKKLFWWLLAILWAVGITEIWLQFPFMPVWANFTVTVAAVALFVWQYRAWNPAAKTAESSAVPNRHLPAHLQVPWKVGQAVWVFFASWLVFPVLAIVALREAAPHLHLAARFFDAFKNQNVYASFGLVLFSALVGLGLVWYYLRRYRLSWAAVGWRRFSPGKAAGLFVVGFAGFAIGVAALFALAGLLDPGFNATQPQTQVHEYTGQAGQAHPGIALLALVIVPPILEETFFRGFLFPALAGRLGLGGGMIVTSLLFGVAHLQANVGIYTFVLSLVLCYLYYKLRSIIPGIALHMLNNYLAYLALVHK